MAPEAAGRTWSLEELVGTSGRFKFTVIPADASSGKARPIVDASKRVFGAVIPPLRAEGMDEPDPTFIVAADECAALLESNRPKLFKHRDGTAKTPPKHRQGIFAVKAVGVSFGGGQEILQYPKQIYHSEAHLKILDSLLATICFIHLAQHASSAFFCWAPRLYFFYAENRARIEKESPDMCWNFAKTLGNFNHQKGGHFVLWDLGLSLSFPQAGPFSSLLHNLRHSNTIIGVNETRYSLTQYTARGLFCIVNDNGHVHRWMSEVDLAEAMQKQREHYWMDLTFILRWMS
ncbi:hypothetical protein BT96DRAFT_949975 [Gymnopus androsaceus JB14]|uniref:Uncharacterized protein n=1 Tax=Gymnopus androsaceus JB14 TaxID=1447944 RepID=A0A6A4GIN5_9AGAR|nr:hypothetical protein BT96DRAFT_949975 [Gymnopus androsaceus JB14]